MTDVLVTPPPASPRSGLWKEPFANTKKRAPARTLRKPAKQAQERIALVLDLDECLVHSFHLKAPAAQNNSDGASQGRVGNYRQREYRPAELTAYTDSFQVLTELGDTFQVNKRPGLDSFLRIAVHFFDLYLFSAAQETYVKPVVKYLDPEGKIFKGLFFRQHCVLSHKGAFMKNLELIRPSLTRVVLVDNNPASVVLQPRNAIPVSSFFDNENDRELQCVLDVMMRLREEEDVRNALHSMFKLEHRLGKYRDQMMNPQQRSVIKRFFFRVRKLANNN